MQRQSHQRIRPDDSTLDAQIGILLRTGMAIAALVILSGGVMFLALNGHSIPDYHVFKGEPESLKTLPGIVTGAVQGHDRSIIQFGLLLLIATPVARVVFSVLVFLKARDYLYVVISGIVLVVLMYSLIWH